MVSHKIKQINTPLRFKNVVLIFLIKVINISLEQKKFMYLYRKNYTLINQNRQNHIPLNGRYWNDFKEESWWQPKEKLSLKTRWYEQPEVGYYTNQKTTELSWAYPTMHSLLVYHQSQGRVRTKENSNQNFHEFRTVLMLSANIEHVKYKISTFPEVM